MAENILLHEITAYDHWKNQLIETIEAQQRWLDQQGLDRGENSIRIIEAIEALKNDRLNIAFVAEFSRGKTELINSIFFADHGRRLLPTAAGRTTMCPTELYYDRDKDSAYLRLLPIETRLEDTTIADYKQEPLHWTNIPLDIDSSDQMEETLKEIIRTKQVSRKEAARLGLYSKEMFPHLTDEDGEPEQIEIPAWRHALISYPHPLLKQGLVILDTPGLNALGSEPELTMSMLPAAQAILFVLAADTGVTRTDLEMWKNFVSTSSDKGNKPGISVVLNKIDTLWDDLKDADSVYSSIQAQVQNTAEQLGIQQNSIYTVSAQKGLLAKIRNDEPLLNKSQLPRLEQYLTKEVLPAREAILRDHIIDEIGGVMEDTRQVLASRLEKSHTQLKELRQLNGKNTGMLNHLIKKTREEQVRYQKNAESFQASRRVLRQRAATMQESLSLNSFDNLISESRKSMSDSWTTSGLKKGMQTFFEGVRFTMEQVTAEAHETRKLVMAIYKKFETEHGLPSLNTKKFHIEQYYQQMEQLYEEGENFRKSPVTTMTEQGFVIKKFFINLVSRSRDIFFRANQEAESWLSAVLNPLVSQINEHRKTMEKRLNSLRKVSESRTNLESQIKQLEAEVNTLTQQLKAAQQLQNRLIKPMPEQTSSAA